jgi:AcrR family transcriptional regulator
LAAAREVFLADPNAPIALVAERAGVGISALYHRYRSKEELLRQLNRDGLRLYIESVEEALADRGDPWSAFARFMHRVVVEDDTHSLSQRLAGTFTPTEDIYRDAIRARDLGARLLERTQEAGAIRADLVVDDIGLLFEQLASVRLRDPERTKELRRRSLALVLRALNDPAGEPLPGPPPTGMELAEKWEVET